MHVDWKNYLAIFWRCGLVYDRERVADNSDSATWKRRIFGKFVTTSPDIQDNPFRRRSFVVAQPEEAEEYELVEEEPDKIIVLVV